MSGSTQITRPPATAICASHLSPRSAISTSDIPMQGEWWSAMTSSRAWLRAPLPPGICIPTAAAQPPDDIDNATTSATAAPELAGFPGSRADLATGARTRRYLWGGRRPLAAAARRWRHRLDFVHRARASRRAAVPCVALVHRPQRPDDRRHRDHYPGRRSRASPASRSANSSQPTGGCCSPERARGAAVRASTSRSPSTSM